jgi:hypothetical protein
MAQQKWDPNSWPPLQVPKLLKAPRIDGDLSEFKDAFCTPVEYHNADLKNRAGQFFYMWDDEAFYAGLRTLDTKPANFADDDVFLNTGISFPIAFRAADVRGADVKLTLPRWGALSGFAGYSYLLGRAELPVTGGLFLGSEAAGALAQTDRIAISQDQRHTARARLRYQLAPVAWTAAVVRYGSGLPVELDDDVDRDELVAHFGSRVVDRVDFDAGRLHPNITVDWAAGVELWRRDKRRVELRAGIANLTNRLNVVNFAGLFSGTAVAPPRSANVRVRLEF